jgi:hypothetical protein
MRPLGFAAPNGPGGPTIADADLVDLMEAPKQYETEGRPTARGGRRQRSGSRSEYFIQPAKQGQFMVLRRPCGNRVTPKVCGTMPSRAHAQALVRQLEKAESAVNDLFLEATDDGIEALEAVLAACCESVLQRGPGRPAAGGGPGRDAGGGRGARSGRRGRGRRQRGQGRSEGGGQSGRGGESHGGRESPG